MRLKKIVSYDMGENCYIISDEKSGDTVIFDPGCEAEKVMQYIDGENLNVKAILLTHGHYDHITACKELKEKYNVPVIAHEYEKEVVGSKGYNLSSRFMDPMTLSVDRSLKDNDEYEVGDMKIKVIHTPGHTPGGCCYYFVNEKVLISGDTLFQYSIGRTDFPGGDTVAMMESLKKLFTQLDGDVVVYPGHGEKTTIEFERRNNPYADF
ncbi:MAG: MBL fold metallo-hydrolase [Firmicutes bacterium]|nr:MBL fold metallo-hydrolase [Bacillota bacterium]